MRKTTAALRVKQSLAWIGAILGTLTLFASKGELHSIILSLAMLIPGAWWLWCDRADKKAAEEYGKQAKEHNELHSLLSHTDPDVAAQMTPPDEPAKKNRKWVIVAPLSFALLLIGTSMLPKGSKTEVSPPSPSIATTTSASNSPTKTEASTITAAPSTVTVTSEPAPTTPANEPQQGLVSPYTETHTPQPVNPPPATQVYYGSCAEARSAGAAPLYSGQPGYRSGLDRDGDGIACDKVG